MLDDGKYDRRKRHFPGAWFTRQVFDSGSIALSAESKQADRTDSYDCVDVLPRRMTSAFVAPGYLEGVIRVESPDEAGLAAAMDKGAVRCIEGSADFAHSVTRETLTCAVRNFLLADLTTSSAYRSAVSRNFCRWIERTTGFVDLPYDAIETALVEAVVNGIVHGNLELPSQYENGTLNAAIAAHESYYEAIERQLERTRFGMRRLAAAAWWRKGRVDISVYDQGPGYDVELVAHQKRNKRYSGRGIDVIAAMSTSYCIEDGGRSITMRFDAP